MFFRWYRKSGRVHRLYNVFMVELVSTGDVQVHHIRDGKRATTVLFRGSDFDSVTIEQETKQHENKTT